MDSISKGYIGSILVEKLFILNNFNIFKPVTENGKVDLIVEKNNIYLKLQIKTVQIDRGNKIIPVRKVSHNMGNYKVTTYSSSIIDYFVGVDLDTEDLYIIPSKISEQYKSSISISKVEIYRNNFNLLEPYIRNDISGHDKFGESLASKVDGNSEVVSL